MAKLKLIGRRIVLIWEDPRWSALSALVIYTLIALARDPQFRISFNPYYNYLADAFLHGQLHLRVTPISIHDLAIYNDRYYLYWAPFPAILMMPFVAIFGVGFNDVPFTLAIGSLNVCLVACFLRVACLKGLFRLNRLQRGLLVMVFALGTVHITLAPFARVWSTGQVVAFGCTALAFLAALRLEGWKAFLFTGISVACAMLTRTHLLLIGIWPAYYLLNKYRSIKLGKLTAYVLLALLPVLLAISLTAAYNWARFGDPLETGIRYQHVASVLRADYEKYGQFHVRNVPKNFYYHYIFYPFPVRVDTGEGGSLFLLTPVFFAMFWGLTKGRPRLSIALLGLTIILIAIPSLLLLGTGWFQYGPRYTLDYTIPLLFLTAIGIRKWPLSLTALLVELSIFQYFAGVLFQLMVDL